MEKEDLFYNELWQNICQTTTDLYYLEELRDRKAKIEPIYKGALATMAIVTAVLDIVDVEIYSKIAAVVTAIMALIPFLYPTLPKAKDFSDMDSLRVELKTWLIDLEKYWWGEWTDKAYLRYTRDRKNQTKTDTDIAAVFGTINKKLEKTAQKKAHAYLDKFYPTSPS